MEKFDYEIWIKDYYYKQLINVKKYLSDDDLNILNKLGYEIEEKLYTNKEFDVLIGKLLSDFYIDFDEIDGIKPEKELAETGVERERYNKLLDNLFQICNLILVKGSHIEMKEKYQNENFNIPYYLFEEIIEYIEETAKGKCKSMKWKNIKKLIRLAVINNRLTKNQGEYLIDNICREHK